MSSTLTARTELVPPHAVMSLLRAAPTPVKEDVKDVASAGGGAAGGTAGGKRVGGGVADRDSRDARDARDARDSRDRSVLGRVNVNVNVTSAGLLRRRAPAKSIPRPAAAPDVFAPEPRATGTATATATTSLGKRARDTAAPNTAAIAKRQRAEATAAAAKSHREEQDRWLQKWQKVFPTLVFHFEIGVEDGRGLRQRVLGMGAKIDQFFSQRVSHLIVKGGGTPQKAKPTRKGTYSGAASDNPFLDKTGTTDLVDKAKALNIKVWTVKKLSDMVDKLAPLDNATGDSLSHLLADEKVNGTRERDMSAPRPDYYYFKPGNKFLLVEDATGRSRPIMVKEYTAKERAWPVLHEHFLRLTTSSQPPASVANSHNLFKDIRARALALYVDQVPFRGELPPAPELKPRSKDGDEIPLTPAIPDALPYVKASGNSVVITSNIASTSTANLTPNAFQGGVPQLGANKDRAIMQMSKRVQVLKGNARMAASVSAKTGSENIAPESTPTGGHIPRRRSTGFDAPATAPPKEFLSQAQVIAMLHQLRGPTTVPKPTYEERAKNHEEVTAGYKRKDQDTASGYCENCRVRYTDLSVHIASRKHRRFATTAKNFADLDVMLECVQRPPSALICVPTRVCRPCTKEHHQDAECGRCRDNPELFSSPPPSSMGSSPASVRRRRDYDMEHDDDDTLDAGLEAIDEESNGDDDEQWEEGDRPLD